MKVIKDNPANWKVHRRIANYGNQPYKYDYLSYAGGYGGDSEEMENFIFEATLIPMGASRGRSAVRFEFYDVDGHGSYTMGLKRTEQLIGAIAEGSIKVENGGFTGKFTFFKQGANYSIGLA